MKALILSGGRGTRLAPYTTVIPKPLLPIGERPVLEIIIKQLAYYGFKDITLCVGYLAELIQAYFSNSHNIPKGVRLSYVREEKPLGTAGPIALVKDLKEPFLVINGDVLTTIDFSKLFSFHKKKKAEVTIGVYEKKVKMDLGVIEFSDKEKVKDYIEKPQYTFFDSMGIYVYNPEVLSYIKPNSYLDFPTLVKRLVKEGKNVTGYIHNKSHYWIDVGQHKEYRDANEAFKKRKNDFSPWLRKK